MPIYIGGQQVTAIKWGDDDVIAVYQGTDQVWSKANIFENFETPMAPDLTAGGWTHYGPSTNYKLIAAGGVARINMPDGTSLLGEFIDRASPPGVASNDNAPLRVRIATAGSDPSPSVSAYITDVFLRAHNSAASHGVGIRFNNASVGIVRRVANTDTLMQACGSFGAGDLLELKPAGNLYTLHRNGNWVGEWNDVSGTASVGSGFRKALVRATGGRELFGARRFSPTIDSIEYG